MAMIQVHRPNVGQDGYIAGYQNDQYDQEENFAADTLVLELTETPFDADSIVVSYNGQVKRKDVDWEYLAPNFINILFADPYVTDYSETPYFEIVYPYL